MLCQFHPTLHCQEVYCKVREDYLHVEWMVKGGMDDIFFFFPVLYFHQIKTYIIEFLRNDVISPRNLFYFNITIVHSKCTVPMNCLVGEFEKQCVLMIKKFV